MRKHIRIYRIISISGILLLCVVMIIGTYINTYRPIYKYVNYDRSVYTLDRNKIIVGVWDYQPNKIPDVQILKDAGIELYIGNVSQSLMDMLDKAEIPYLGGSFNYSTYILNGENRPITDYDNIEETYVKRSMLYGDYIYDEPNSTSFDYINSIIELEKEKFPTQLCFFNLHPMYCPDYKFYLNTQTYQQYIDLYDKHMSCDYISFDFYPFDNATSGIDPRYLENLDIIGRACRESGRDMWVITQVGNNSAVYRLNLPKMRMQSYLALAYGAKAIIHSTVTPAWWDDSTAMIDKKGNILPTYYLVKQVASEIHGLSDTYMEYKSKGIFCLTRKYSSSYDLSQQLNKQNLRSKDRDFGSQNLKYISDICSNNGELLVGCFAPIKGQGEAVMLVNMNDPYYWAEGFTNTAQVSFKVSPGKKVSAVIRGVKEELIPVNGVYTLEIDCGGGIFVTVS